ncbi:CDGSH iron-sulfur domain-containing protein [Amphritea sp. 2_MG-2023]|jgi:CDGSH-type Zn-finger protein|uniref:CDGSH iron-sulfur domain-containing protein n=1 Tax=Amphritea TaxID=515417 RepID=UPI001C07A0BE|nr:MULTISPECIES: CDGSH iron-sulfur domain-containing protein [Amphritea]MBU2966577.1 CDGSH iron-sulfur domain-containing protein [Amphritea atlantica]MDO6417564.1 CDGSH iron-sulfur domain-containing protein [Amphritea sp. 2_MG-2023]MDX2424332.1 CDGSH iron-sulfur domain-containing protein [Amphritea sp.]
MTHAAVLRAGDLPAKVDLKEGDTYVWCACGRSATQPFCDGSHKGTGIDPVVFVASKSETVFLCNCKQTLTPPLCDGSHNKPQ